MQTKEKKERNPIFRFRGKILLQSKFGFSQSHICIQIFELCAKKSIEIKQTKEEEKTKTKSTFRVFLVFTYLYFKKKNCVLLAIYI